MMNLEIELKLLNNINIIETSNLILKMTSNLKLATEIELLQLNDLDQYIKDLSQFLKEYSWLFNIHVIDFFTDNSWDKIPEGWREIENVIDLMGLMEMASSNEINVILNFYVIFTFIKF
jgi:hypothetical protein